VGRSIALLLALVAGILIAWSQLRLPAAEGPDAPPHAFSAARAMADVRGVAAAPHPTGSAANHAVRDRLLARMTELGLSPRLRRDDVLAPPRPELLYGGSVETLIGVLPGADPAQPALAIMAHYDSVPGAPGAADDGAGVAAALEVMRALKAQGVPARDVALIVTDGEEAGLLGARGFFAGDPLAKRLGFVLNLEARGSGGRVQMFQTGRDNGGAITLFRKTATRPSAGSLFGEVYARLPNDTDFTLARAAGLSGFNYAFVGRAFDYHEPTDSPDHLQQGSLQDMGAQVLAAAEALAFAPRLPARKPDAVYGVLFGDVVLAYPPAWGWAPLAAAAGLIALANRRARRRRALVWSEVAHGAGAGLYALAAAITVLHLAGALAGGGDLGAERLLAVARRWETAQLLLLAGVLMFATAEAARGRRIPAVGLALACILASWATAGRSDPVGLGAGLVAAILALAIGREALGRPGAWAGVLLLGLAAATAVQLFAPQAAYVLAWPLALGALSAAASDLAADRRRSRLAAMTLLAAAGVGWALIHAHLIAVTAALPALLSLPLFMPAMSDWPLAQPAAGAPPERLTGRALLIAGAALALLVRFDSPWSPRHPQPSFVAYQLDLDAGRAWRVSYPELRSAWSDAALRAEGGRIAPLRHWAWDQPMAAAPARLSAAATPRVAAAHDRAGRLVITVTPPAGARMLMLQLAPDQPAHLSRAGAAPADADLPAGRWTPLRWTAPPAEGLALTLAVPPTGSLQLRWAAELDRWPTGVEPAPAPPPEVMATGRSGMTLVTGSRRLTW
jgi:hypothetical protein